MGFFPSVLHMTKRVRQFEKKMIGWLCNLITAQVLERLERDNIYEKRDENDQLNA